MKQITLIQKCIQYIFDKQKYSNSLDMLEIELFKKLDKEIKSKKDIDYLLSLKWVEENIPESEIKEYLNQIKKTVPKTTK